MAWEKEIAEVHRKRELAKQLGGADGVARQYAKGRMTIRERIDGLLDEGSFQELGMGAGSAYRDENGEITEFLPANFVLGFGKVDGRDCVIGGEDFTLKGGSPNAAGLRKSIYAEDVALSTACPLRLHEGGGGSVTGAGGGKGVPATAAHQFMNRGGFSPLPEPWDDSCCHSRPWPRSEAYRLRLVAAFCVMTSENAQVLVAGPAVVARSSWRTVQGRAWRRENTCPEWCRRQRAKMKPRHRNRRFFICPKMPGNFAPDIDIGDPAERVKRNSQPLSRGPQTIRYAKVISMVVDKTALNWAVYMDPDRSSGLRGSTATQPEFWGTTVDIMRDR